MSRLTRSTVPLLLATVLLGTAAGGRTPLCQGSFLGCHGRAQKIRFCKGACRVVRSICTTAFQQGRLRHRCAAAQVATCLARGGTCSGGACGAVPLCPAAQVCRQGVCVVKPPDRCGLGICPAGFPNCGPDGRCWTQPCSQLCGARNCCGGGFPVCGADGLCYESAPAGGGGGQVPANLPPGTYTVTVCGSGVVVLPCEPAGTIPFQSLAQFQSALDTVIDQWLAATADLPDCSRGATTYSAFDGSSFTASITATCSGGSATVSETVSLTVRLG